MDEPQNLPLVRCRDCCSPLLQPDLVVGPIDGECLVVRFCPDCERRDLVVAADDAVQAWLAGTAASSAGWPRVPMNLPNGRQATQARDDRRRQSYRAIRPPG